jgi:hypothetical protein
MLAQVEIDCVKELLHNNGENVLFRANQPLRNRDFSRADLHLLWKKNAKYQSQGTNPQSR